MAPRGEAGPEWLDRANYVSEWFGHRVHPVVATEPQSLADQEAARCPFLTAATEGDQACIKSSASKGVCNISSTSNGSRQDWLVCPYRALDPALVDNVARRLFGLPADTPTYIAPGPTLARDNVRAALTDTMLAGGAGFFYLQDKLGGEISIPPTDRSPELSFDITLVRLQVSEGELAISRYGILEVQTMDFHGSYRSVVKNLTDALRLHRDGFHDAVRQNPRWLSENIEGPNIANVFKRTFYQMMLKFQIGADESCAGCVLAIPASVWDSWQRHLGRPELVARADGTFRLVGERDVAVGEPPAWIYVFDTDVSETVTPNPIVIRQIIGTDAESIGYYALKVAPQCAVAGIGSTGHVLSSIRQRVTLWWPALAAAPAS